MLRLMARQVNKVVMPHRIKLKSSDEPALTAWKYMWNQRVARRKLARLRMIKDSAEHLK